MASPPGQSEPARQPLPILDYAPPARRRLRQGPRAVGVILGGVAGCFAGLWGFSCCRDALHEGVAIVCSRETQEADIILSFRGVTALGGILLATSALITTRALGRRFLGLWLAAYAGAFAVAAGVCLLYLRIVWRPAVYEAGRARLVEYSSVPILATPLAGCAGVVILLAVLVVVRIARGRDGRSMR